MNTGRAAKPEADSYGFVDCVGAVDLGSKNFKFVFGHRTNGVTTTEFVGKARFELGKEVTENNGLIGERKIQQVMASLGRFARYCRNRGADSVLGIATSAIRNARNHERITDGARALGLRVEIAEGNREGEIGYLAATGGSPGHLVSDAGSRSMQIAWEDGGAIRSRSVQVGYESAFETFVENELCFLDAETGFKKFLDGNFSDLPRRTEQFHALAANTVAAYVNDDGRRGTESVIGRATLAETMTRLRALPTAEYRALTSSLPQSVKILPGLIFIDWIMERTGHAQVCVSQNELPVGLIVEYFLAQK